jgi:DNA-binding NarL/FixJ family response regulator
MHHPPALAPTAAAPAQVSVFLLDDHEAVRSVVRSLMDVEPGITVTGEAGTAAAALARIPALRPDVAALDVRRRGNRMPGTAVPDARPGLPPAQADPRRRPGRSGTRRRRGAIDTRPGRRRQHDGPHPPVSTPRPPAGLTGSEDRVLELIAEGLTNR